MRTDDTVNYHYHITLHPCVLLVHRLLEDIIIRLLRKWKGRCGVDEWEKWLVKVSILQSGMHL